MPSEKRNPTLLLEADPAKLDGAHRRLWIADTARLLRMTYRNAAERYSQAWRVHGELHRRGMPGGDLLSREEVRISGELCDKLHDRLARLRDLLVTDLPALAKQCPLVVTAGIWHLHNPTWPDAESELLRIEVGAAADGSRPKKKQPLSELQEDVWKILRRRTARYDKHGMPKECLTGTEIADELAKNGIRNQTEKSVSDVIGAMRKNGWDVPNKRGQGYYIPKPAEITSN